MHGAGKRGLGISAALSLLVTLLPSCSRHSNSMTLVAPFNDRSVLGNVSAVWSSGGEPRAFAEGVRLKEPQVRFQYRVNVRNQLGDKLFVRLHDFTLIDSAGLQLGKDEKSVACTLAASGADALLSGEVWIAESAVKAVHGFSIGRFAVPLNETGRALYREWLLKGRPEATAQVDGEIAGYAAAPACVAQ